MALAKTETNGLCFAARVCFPVAFPHWQQQERRPDGKNQLPQLFLNTSRADTGYGRSLPLLLLLLLASRNFLLHPLLLLHQRLAAVSFHFVAY